MRLGGARLDQEHCRARWQRAQELLHTRGIKAVSAIKHKHKRRIHPREATDAVFASKDSFAR
jgi:hypothetical protein